MSSADGVLAGLGVVSFCHYLQGPAATQYLADMGADVIKIEPPRGAFERHWGGADRAKVAGITAFFLCANRNKRSLALDLKHPEAKAVVYRLIDARQVVVENFRPGVLDRLGFGYETLKARKPDIIYASSSGFGADGPYRERPGQDLLIQAMSGMAYACGARPAPPVPVGFAAADQHGGALLALGILGAYARWLKTGEGTRVETNLLGAGIDLQVESLVTYFASGRDEAAFTRDQHLATWFHEAPYGVYQIADGYLALSMNKPETLAEALDSPALRALELTSTYRERDRYAALVAEELGGRTLAELAPRFDAAGVWYAPVDSYDDLRRNPQVMHNQVFHEVRVGDRTALLVNHPLRYDGRVPGTRGFALRQGEHGREILAELGYSAAEIERLVASGAVFDPEAAADKETNP